MRPPRHRWRSVAATAILLSALAPTSPYVSLLVAAKDVNPITDTPSSSTSSTTTADGLKIDVTLPPPKLCPHPSRSGDTLVMRYTGRLLSDDSVFDTTEKEGRYPFSFVVGKGEVIKGWDEGLLDMCPGEKRTLTVPPELGYGSRGSPGAIPGGATLVFETELVRIEGVDQGEGGDEDGGEDGEGKGDEEGHKKEDGECHLLGPFALLVQAALGGLAILSLVWKRWREHPRRPLKVWFFDASKQVFGSVLLHLANILMSLMSSGTFDVGPDTGLAGDEDVPNPCSFYLLNLGIDTTVGIPILVLLLRIIHAAALHTPLANPPESLKSGNYGPDSRHPNPSWWLKQSVLYFLGLFGMKMCVFFIFQLLPWLVWVGDWALRWTEGNTALQVAFVMFVFPLVMNGIQYYIIDSFIKDREGGSSGTQNDLAQDRDTLRSTSSAFADNNDSDYDWSPHSSRRLERPRSRRGSDAAEEESAEEITLVDRPASGRGGGVGGAKREDEPLKEVAPEPEVQSVAIFEPGDGDGDDDDDEEEDRPLMRKS